MIPIPPSFNIKKMLQYLKANASIFINIFFNVLLKLSSNLCIVERKYKWIPKWKTYFGVPTFKSFKSMEMQVGGSAPSQQVKIFAVDLVSLRRPTITVTIGNAYPNINKMKKIKNKKLWKIIQVSRCCVIYFIIDWFYYTLVLGSIAFNFVFRANSSLSLATKLVRIPYTVYE